MYAMIPGDYAVSLAITLSHEEHRKNLGMHTRPIAGGIAAV